MLPRFRTRMRSTVTGCSGRSIPSTATVAMRSTDNLPCVDFIGERVPGAASPVAQRVSALNHESANHPMERRPVVKLFPREREEILDGLRRVRAMEFKFDLAEVGTHDDAR